MSSGPLESRSLPSLGFCELGLGNHHHADTGDVARECTATLSRSWCHLTTAGEISRTGGHDVETVAVRHSVCRVGWAHRATGYGLRAAGCRNPTTTRARIDLPCGAQERLARPTDSPFFERTVGLRRVQTDDGKFVTVPIRRVVPRAGLDVKHGLQSFCLPPPPDRAFSHPRFGPSRAAAPLPFPPPPPPQSHATEPPPGWGPSRPSQPDEATGQPAEWLCHRKLSAPHLKKLGRPRRLQMSLTKLPQEPVASRNRTSAPETEWLRTSPDSVLHEHQISSEPQPLRLPSVLKCVGGEAELRRPLPVLPAGCVRPPHAMEGTAVSVRGLDVAVEPASTAGPTHVEFAVLHRTRMRSTRTRVSA